MKETFSKGGKINHLPLSYNFNVLTCIVRFYGILVPIFEAIKLACFSLYQEGESYSMEIALCPIRFVETIKYPLALIPFYFFCIFII